VKVQETNERSEKGRVSLAEGDWFPCSLCPFGFLVQCEDPTADVVITNSHGEQACDLRVSSFPCRSGRTVTEYQAGFLRIGLSNKASELTRVPGRKRCIAVGEDRLRWLSWGPGDALAAEQSKSSV
jgi:hypothetical protein